jgi:hypothetical protein
MDTSPASHVVPKGRLPPAWLRPWLRPVGRHGSPFAATTTTTATATTWRRLPLNNKSLAVLRESNYR